MLPLKRDEVTYRIVSALSALIGPHLEIASTDKKLIQEAVQRTLEIKAKALTIPRTIIVSTVKSGTTFDPDLMEAEFEEAYPVATLNGGAPVVKMCLFPALYFDERDRRADELSAGAGPVCQKMQVADASEQNTSHIKILTKAVVLLEE